MENITKKYIVYQGKSFKICDLRTGSTFIKQFPKLIETCIYTPNKAFSYNDHNGALVCGIIPSLQALIFTLNDDGSKTRFYIPLKHKQLLLTT